MESLPEKLAARKNQIDNICVFFIPILLKAFAILSSSEYLILLGLSAALTIVLVTMTKKGIIKTPKAWIMSLSFSLSIILCSIVSSNIKTKQDNYRLAINIDSSFRDKYEKLADNGNVQSMVAVGAYYAFRLNRLVIQTSPDVLRDDEFFDVRDFIKASRFLNMAADSNSVEAYCLLGEMKIQGLGCLPSRKQALEFLAKAYERDSTNSLLQQSMTTHAITKEEIGANK